jgi:hypothetical protein
MSGRALLIGASRYGGDTGFIDLPADRDVELMRQTLQMRNFSVQVADEETTRNATLLDRKITDFCAEGGGAELSIVYFSGHGMSIAQQDWIIPAGVSREHAISSSNQRVPTDLSGRIASTEGGLILLIVDACRDEDSTAKGSPNAWSHGVVARRDRHFIRFFGCSAGEACHVLRRGHDGKDISVFTKALSLALSPGSPTDTLGDVLKAAATECVNLAKAANPRLPAQEPCVNIAGDTPAVDEDPLRLRLFAGRVAGKPTFGPDSMNCLVIESEHARHDSGQSLSDRVRHTFSKAGAAIWQEFREGMKEVRFVDGSVRNLPGTYDPSLRVIDSRSIVDVFGSDAALEQATLAAVRADVAFFDVSRFEPGVMFLLGVRAALRRGVTVCSHGCGWREGEPLDKPFNLADLQIFSHARGSNVGADPVVQRFIDGVQSGLRQLRQQPRYQDLPAFDALRELGTDANASGTIPWDTFVLMLCSFREEHLNGWLYVRGKLEDALQARGTKAPRVQRLIDTGSPQLISQALYENIRRASACVMDWSYYSPSAFLELGVRLAVSPWGALQLVDERFRPSAESAPHIKRADQSTGPELKQIALMVKRFEPKPYRLDSDASFDALLAMLVQRKPFDEEAPEYNTIYRLIQKEVGSVSTALPPIHEVMHRAAEALSDAQQDRQAASQILFSGNEAVKRDRERAALEYRISAWLYLEHRVGARSKPEGDALRETHRKLGQIIAAALYETDKAEDFALAQHIEDRLRAEKSR